LHKQIASGHLANAAQAIVIAVIVRFFPDLVPLLRILRLTRPTAGMLRSPPKGNEQMPQTEELGSAHQRGVDAVVPMDIRRRRLDWAVVVVMFALGCTLGWISLLLWGAVRAFQIALL